MSEVTITGIIEKVNNIFSLFKALLTPGKFQDSVLWQKEALIILSLAFCLITAISIVAFSLIRTLKKRQRNYKELVNALEEDGAEIDYNLKPILLENSIEPPTAPTPANIENPIESSHEDSEYAQYIEELTSKIEDQEDSHDNIYESQDVSSNHLASVLTASPQKTEKKIFSLTLNHLTKDDTKPDSETHKVIQLSMANLKIEPSNVSVVENEALPIDENNPSNDSITPSPESQPVSSHVTADAMNASLHDDENYSISTTDDINSDGKDLIEDSSSENTESPFESENIFDGELLDGGSSIWDEVKEVVNDLESSDTDFDSEDENFISELSQDDVDEESNGLDNENMPDLMEIEAESVISEFALEEAWDDQESVKHGSDSDQAILDEENPINSTINNELPLADYPNHPELEETKTPENMKKTIEFLPIEEDSSEEYSDSKVSINSSENSEDLNDQIVSEAVGEICRDINQSPTDNNFDEETSTDIQLNSVSYDTDAIEEEICDESLPLTNNKVISIPEELVLNEDVSENSEKHEFEDIKYSNNDRHNSFEDQDETEDNSLELNNIVEPALIEESTAENIENSINEKVEEKELKQLSLDFESEAESLNINSQIDRIENQNNGNENQLSPKTARRIIERLEFFKNNINKRFS